MRCVRWAGGSILLCVLAQGCADQARAQAGTTLAQHNGTSLAQKCAPLLRGAEPPTRVLLEVAELAEAPRQPLDAWLESPVRVARVGNVLAQLGAPASMPWPLCSDEACRERVSASLHVQLSQSEAPPGRVQASLELRAPDGELLERAELPETDGQKPTLFAWQRAAQNVVETPYSIASDRDLQSAAQCRREQRAAP